MESNAREVRDALTQNQCDFYDLMDTYKDTSIETLFNQLASTRTDLPRREMQQAVSSKITRINKIIKKYGVRIAPGDARHTYRLRAS